MKYHLKKGVSNNGFVWCVREPGADGVEWSWSAKRGLATIYTLDEAQDIMVRDNGTHITLVPVDD